MSIGTSRKEPVLLVADLSRALADADSPPPILHRPGQDRFLSLYRVTEGVEDWHCAASTRPSCAVA
jgi:hypothetical protein